MTIVKEEKFIGTVVWFSNFYGFIHRDNNEPDIFVHWSDIAKDKGYKSLKKDQVVSFSIGLNNSKKIKAIDVVILKDAK
jgi:cold shock CspA family protein